MKAMPTDDQIASYGNVADAFEYLSSLQEDNASFESFLESRATPWGHEPRAQPMHRCVAHLLTVIVRTIEGKTRGGDDGQLTPSEVSDWLKKASSAAK